ncbi:hypothetical protein [Pseudosporangium ferrugineum]|uniref:Uncharacterized protein n=1 Tax=Pseudosporangium ferrugineum TaxID=439699 RepID=A0A2T0RSB6_9ACTN|nr:hypothetical protein [Pseudosporangium ferrugineum]PRY24051.1 hypothetical protein CLV70_114184 [Pseudosporangium ferrugineum]
MTTLPERMPRPGEDPTDWAFAVGEMSEAVYRLMRPNGTATRSVKAAAKARAAYGDGDRPLTHAVAASSSSKAQASALPPGRVAAATSRDLRGIYSANPLVAEAQATGVYASAAEASGGMTPTLFQSGDVPAFTASGIDPSLLRNVPWAARHALATEPDRTRALQLFEDLSGPDGEVLAAQYEDHSGNKEYRDRVLAWQQAGWDLHNRRQQERQAEIAEAQAAEVRAAIGDPEEWSEEQGYEYLFGELDRRRADVEFARDVAILEGRSVGEGADMAALRRSVEARVAASGGRLTMPQRLVGF